MLTRYRPIRSDSCRRNDSDFKFSDSWQWRKRTTCFGPLFPIEIHVPAAFAQLLTANQQPVPAPIMGFALIDTGATSSCVDQHSMLSLGVSPIGIHPVAGVGEVANHPVYPAQLAFPNNIVSFAFGARIGVNLLAQSQPGAPIVALIGRDILSGCVLVYNGTTGLVTLAF
jgi:hypothetical protein